MCMVSKQHKILHYPEPVVIIISKRRAVPMLFSGWPQTARLRTLPLLVNHYITFPIILQQGPRKT